MGRETLVTIGAGGGLPDHTHAGLGTGGSIPVANITNHTHVSIGQGGFINAVTGMIGSYIDDGISVLALSHFLSIVGELANNTTEGNSTVLAPTAMRLSNFTIELTTNTQAASTWAFRKNTADGSETISVAASTTGEFTDATNTDDVASGDDICAAMTSAGPDSGGITLQSITFATRSKQS